ncbi:DUF3313 family protein [Ramlibacter sp. MMS24-I3-19]|uniref:DUF3313 family protein n=1 Tax=Ramlibacter sp. MMS24-I3-19 TaxID=3416606 RepID=UPI003CFF8F73
MTTMRWIRRATVLAALVAAPVAFADFNGSLDQLVPAQGLQRTQLAGLGLASVRPGASLGSYDRVLLEPVDVSFRRDWKPYRTGSVIPLGPQEREALRKDVARSVQQAFAATLPQHGLVLANEAGPGVLRMKLKVVDVYLNNPWTPTPGRSRVLAASSGEMTLVAELSDARSGELLLRAGDWQDMRNPGRLLPSNDVRTGWDVDRTAQLWASAVADAMRPPRGVSP